MKYFIYIKNTKNEFLGIYQLINEDGLKPLNPNLINNTKNKSIQVVKIITII